MTSGWNPLDWLAQYLATKLYNDLPSIRFFLTICYGIHLLLVSISFRLSRFCYLSFIHQQKTASCGAHLFSPYWRFINVLELWQDLSLALFTVQVAASFIYSSEFYQHLLRCIYLVRLTSRLHSLLSSTWQPKQFYITVVDILAFRLLLHELRDI